MKCCVQSCHSIGEIFCNRCYRMCCKQHIDANNANSCDKHFFGARNALYQSSSDPPDDLHSISTVGGISANSASSIISVDRSNRDVNYPAAETSFSASTDGEFTVDLKHPQQTDMNNNYSLDESSKASTANGYE